MPDKNSTKGKLVEPGKSQQNQEKANKTRKNQQSQKISPKVQPTTHQQSKPEIC
jgi:hypothetical protein